jgi:lysozyme
MLNIAKKSKLLSARPLEPLLSRKDLSKFEAAVCSAVKTQKCPLHCNQLNALVSFAFNVGIGGFEGSKIYEHMANRDYKLS